MKKIKISISILILTFLLGGYYIYYSQCVRINYWYVYKVEVYRHNEKILSDPSYTPGKADLVLSFRGYNELENLKGQTSVESPLSSALL